MGVKLFNWTNKKKLVMVKNMVSMVINKAIGYTYKNTHSSPATHSMIQNLVPKYAMS